MVGSIGRRVLHVSWEQARLVLLPVVDKLPQGGEVKLSILAIFCPFERLAQFLPWLAVWAGKGKTPCVQAAERLGHLVRVVSVPSLRRLHLPQPFVRLTLRRVVAEGFPLFADDVPAPPAVLEAHGHSRAE